MNIALVGILLAVVVLLAGAGGYAFRDSRAVRDIAAANSDTKLCTDAAALKQTALESVVQSLADLRTRHADMVKAADEAIASRDDEIATLARRENERTNRLTRAGHEDQECIALASMPVCAAVARELWPDEAPSRDHPPADH